MRFESRKPNSSNLATFNEQGQTKVRFLLPDGTCRGNLKNSDKNRLVKSPSEWAKCLHLFDPRDTQLLRQQFSIDQESRFGTDIRIGRSIDFLQLATEPRKRIFTDSQTASPGMTTISR